jgi:mannose-6-phosphate isomerase-like protein (cupin superfamily)
VQWNTWLHRGENAAYVAVNLEGMKYDGWPIARFIEREFRHPRLFEVVRQLAAPESIQMIFHRDAWQVSSRPAIEERHIGLSGRALAEIDPEGWKRTLQEAYDCLDADRGHRHRARQMVTTKSGRVELSVSPHLKFRQRISDVAEGQRMGGWVASCKGGAPAAVRLCEGAVLSVILMERKCDRPKSTTRPHLATSRVYRGITCCFPNNGASGI